MVDTLSGMILKTGRSLGFYQLTVRDSEGWIHTLSFCEEKLSLLEDGFGKDFKYFKDCSCIVEDTHTGRVSSFIMTGIDEPMILTDNKLHYQEMERRGCFNGKV